MTSTTAPEFPKTRGRKPKTWTLGDPDFQRPGGMMDRRWRICCQILWTLALDFDGSIEDRNASGKLRDAMEARGIEIDSQVLNNILRDLADSPRWGGILGRQMQRTVTRGLWLTVTPDKLPPNPFTDEPANLPAVVDEPRPKPTSQLGRAHQVPDPVPSNGSSPLPDSAELLPDRNPVDLPDMHLSELTNSEELSLAISLIANVISRDAIEAGTATNETALAAIQENLRLKEELTRKDARIRELVGAVQHMRVALERQPVSV